MNTWNERIKAELEAQGKTAASLARACGVKPPSVSDWISGKTLKIEAENLLRAARFLSVHPEWLRHGRGPKYLTEGPVDLELIPGARPISGWDDDGPIPDTHQGIQRIQVYLSAGRGLGVAEESPPYMTPNVFRSDFMRGAGWSAKTHFSMYVAGDSMEPTVPDGSTVVVDTSEKEPKGSKSQIFAVMVDEEPRLKRVLKLPSGAYRVSSDNPHPDYASFDIGPESRHELKILGRVVYMQTKLD